MSLTEDPKERLTIAAYLQTTMQKEAIDLLVEICTFKDPQRIKKIIENLARQADVLAKAEAQ